MGKKVQFKMSSVCPKFQFGSSKGGALFDNLGMWLHIIFVIDTFFQVRMASGPGKIHEDYFGVIFLDYPWGLPLAGRKTYAKRMKIN